MADMTLKMLLLGQDVSASRALKGVGRTTEETAGKFGKWHAAAAIAGAAAGAAVFKFGKDSVSAYEDAQAQQAQLEAAYKKFPALADTNIGSLRKLNSELERKTGFDDDATASGQAVLAQFGLTGKQITSLTPLLQDYAKRTGKDLPTAAKDLGKAVEGQGKALKNVGVNFKDTHDKAGNFDELMKGLSGTVGGFAENQGKTAAGQTQILKAEFGELEETVGSKLVPALTGLVGVGLAVVDFISKNASVIGPLVVVLGSLAAIVYTIITAQKIWTAVQTAFNIVMSANPIGLIIIAVAALIVIIIIAWKHSETFRAIVLGALHGIEAGFHATVGAIKTAWAAVYSHVIDPVKRAATWIAGRITAIVGWFRGVPGKLGSALGSVASAITSPFRTAFNYIADAWNNTVGRLHWSIPSWVPKIGGNSISVPQLPHFAAGAIINRPTVGLFGEAGPEAVIPLSAGRSQGGFGGGDVRVTINFNGPVDKAAVGKQVTEALVEYQRQQRRALPLLTSGAIG